MMLVACRLTPSRLVMLGLPRFALMSTAITRSAPLARATEMGMLSTTPPSTRIFPWWATGWNTPGMAELARTALATEPRSSTTL